MEYPFYECEGPALFPVRADRPLEHDGSTSTADTDTETNAMQMMQHPSFYFEHGDIALSARYSDTLTYIFRVHRLFLSHHSVVFKDIIEALGTEEGPKVEEYDGVPLIALGEEDEADDVASLLEVIYDVSALPRKLGVERRADLPLMLSGLLDISSRYKVQGIIDTIKEHIRKEWPVTLLGWEVRQLEFISTSSTHDVLPEAVSAIQFATTHEIPIILPSAFYLLAITPTKSDWNDHRPTNISAARWFELGDTNAVRFAKGRDAMIEFYLRESEKDLVPTRDQRGLTNYHLNGGACQCDYNPLLLELKLLAVNHHLDCLKALQTLMDRCKHDHKFCDACMVRMELHFQRVRTEIWSRLPDFFIVKEDGNRLTWNA